MFDPDTDAETQTRLLGRIAARDRQALAELYDQVAGVLFSTATRILGDAHEAEEVVQDVFVQIWEKAATFDARLGSPIHWTLRIARNRAIDRLRSRQRRTRLVEQLQVNAAVEATTQTAPVLASLGPEELMVIRSAVQGLPTDQRQAIEMAFFGGLTHQEIAESLKEPLGTVKARIRRGMLKLRESLQAYL